MYRREMLPRFEKLHVGQLAGLVRAGEAVWPDLSTARKAEAANVTEEDLTWAYAALISRGFQALSGGPALVPLLDEINMDLPVQRNVHWFQRFDGSFRAYASADVPKGEELFIDYIVDHLHPSNTELVANYGFVLQDYPTQATSLSEHTCEEIGQRADRLARGSSSDGAVALCAAKQGNRRANETSPPRKSLLRQQGLSSKTSSSSSAIAASAAASSQGGRRQRMDPQKAIFCSLWRLAAEECPGLEDQ